MAYCDPTIPRARPSKDPHRPWNRQRDRSQVHELLKRDKRDRIKRNQGRARARIGSHPSYLHFDRSPLLRSERLRRWCLIPEGIDPALWDAAHAVAAQRATSLPSDLDSFDIAAEVLGWMLRRGRWPTRTELGDDLALKYGWDDTNGARAVDAALNPITSIHVAYTNEVIAMGEAPEYGDKSGYIAVTDGFLHEAAVLLRFQTIVDEIQRFGSPV